MKVTTLNIGALPASYGIVLGRRGETEATQIIFDVSSLVSTYGDGSAVLMVKRPTDTDAYPAVIERVDNTVVWTITTTETEYKGSGKCELFWYVDETLAKSIVFRTVVMEDIGAVVSDPPDPYESWVESLTALGAETERNALAAEQSADDAEAAAGLLENCTATAVTLEPHSEATASYDNGVFTFGIPRGADGSGGGGGTGDYNDLSNKPSIGGVTLSGNKTPAQLGLAAASDIPDVPVQSVNGQTGAVVLNASDVGAGTYTKPSGGIPASDLSSAVQTSLGKANTALQSVPSTYRTASAQDVIDTTKITAPSSPTSGAFLVWDGSAWTAQTLSVWQGGSY